MNPTDFVHLHVHSHYSLLDGACKIVALADLAKRHGMTHLALTDHGNLFGAIEFYNKMRAAGVQPILGYEAYVAPGSRKEKHSTGGIKEASYHLTLLAADVRGYHNLLKLASAAYLDGFYYRPRIDVELLSQHKDGLIVLSGCASSEVCQRLTSGRDQDALEAAARYADILGKDNFFIEVQDNGLPDQKRCVEGLVRIADDLGLGLAATNDIHYAAPEDAAAHEVLLCINTGKTLAAQDRMRFGSSEFYFKSGDEMIQRFGHLAGAIENTRAIAERCRVELDFTQRHFPHFAPPDGLDNDTYLRRLCEEGIKRRYSEPSREVLDRLEYELQVIREKGFSSYFLIVWDIVRFVKSRGIAIGLRGSGVSSLVCYALNVSDIDPLRYNLIFDRFLPRERREAPDLDIDLCESRRDEVIQYVREKYGRDHTAQIITFGTMRARAVVKDVARVLGWSVAEAEALAKRIPATLNITLKEALEQDESLSNEHKNDPRTRELLEYAFKLEGLARHASTHAAGVVIADKALTEHIPLCTLKDVVMSQYAMNDLEAVGMLKVDLLGLNTLTIVDKTLDLVEASTGVRPDLSKIPLDDPKTYDLIGRGDTKAVFQLGSSGMQELLKRLRPEGMEDIIAVVAMYRPGPLQSGMVDDFIARRQGKREVTYIDHRLEPMLKDTYGVIVYQEQIMRILNELGGLLLGDALTTIKAISKKKAHEIDAREAAFLEGAQQSGIPKRVAKEIFELIQNFAQYGFNRAHSTAYAFLAYRTAYLKANYPMEFTAADLTCEMGHSDKLKDHIRDCRQHMGITLLPPCINEGRAEFSVCGDRSIRFGMAGVRNVGMKAVEAILRARDDAGPFNSIHNFCERVDNASVNRQAAESLIKAGAFDSVPGHRAQKLAVLEEAMRMGVRAQQDRRRGQKGLFDPGDDGAPPPAYQLPDIPEWAPVEMGRHEKQALGMRLSFDPLGRFAVSVSLLTDARATDLSEKDHNAPVVVAGEVVAFRPLLTRRGRSMAHVEIEDATGTIRAVVFPDVFDKFGPLLKEDAILFFLGKTDRTGDRAGIQIREVIPADEALMRLSTSVRIRLEQSVADSGLLKRLRSVCVEHRGDCPVFVELVMPGNKRVLIKTDRDMSVKPSEAFAADVVDLVGQGNLQVALREMSANGSFNGTRRRSR